MPARTAEIEALIFASDGPVGLAALRRAFSDLTRAELESCVKTINAELDETARPYEVAEVAGGYQFRTRAGFADALRAMQPERRARLSKPALETLAVVAYRQPTTRAQIEDLRCVDCGAVLRGLLERDLVRIVGRRDAPGRPVLYGTTSRFLEAFTLSSLRDLPELRELDRLDEERGTPLRPPEADDVAGPELVADDAGPGRSEATDEPALDERDETEEAPRG